jgi:hypothetical protein
MKVRDRLGGQLHRLSEDGEYIRLVKAGGRDDRGTVPMSGATP